MTIFAARSSADRLLRGAIVGALPDVRIPCADEERESDGRGAGADEDPDSLPKDVEDLLVERTRGWLVGGLTVSSRGSVGGQSAWQDDSLTHIRRRWGSVEFLLTKQSTAIGPRSHSRRLR